VAAYRRAITLLAAGKRDAADEVLRQLADGADVSIAQVAACLLEHPTLAAPRHFEPPRPLTALEAARLTGRDVTAVYFDPYIVGTWAATERGFLVRIDEFERCHAFDRFPALHGLTGDLTVRDMRFYPDWCYAATTHGICRYARQHGDWQFVPTIASLDEAPVAPAE
jgi:hypothetical protein